MKKELYFLKFALVFLSSPVILISIFVFPEILQDASVSSDKMARVLYGIFAIMCITIIPFLMGVYQTFKLLGYIDSDNAFSVLSVNALSKIKKYAMSISVMYFCSMPLFFIVGEIDDAPGVILLGLIFVFSPLIVGVFAHVLQKLLEQAIYSKN